MSDGQTITVSKDMGLVTQVFDERRIAPLEGHLAIGHVRYSTTGSSSWRNAQPVYRSVGDAGFALGHNGNLTNTARARRAPRHAPRARARRQRVGLDSTTDSALVAELIGHEYEAQARTDGRSSSSALRARAAAARGRLLVRDDGRGPPHRRARPARVLAARARSHRGRLGARQRDRRARHRRRALRARGRARRDDRDRRVGPARRPALRRGRPQALPLRVRLLRPPRHQPLRQERPRRAPAHGRGARPPGDGRRRHGDAGARVGHPRRAGLRAASRASPTATAW